MFKILTSENEGLHREVLVQGNATTSVMEDCELVLASTWAPLFAVNVEGLINVWSRGMVSVTGLQKATGLRIEELSLTKEAKVDVINVLRQILHGAMTTVDFKMVFNEDTGSSVSLVMTAVARRDVNRDVIGIYCSGHQINKYAQAPAPDIMALLPWGSSTMTETEQLALEGEEASVEGEKACLEAEACLEGEETPLEGEEECLEGEEEHLEREEACLQGNEVGFSRPIARPIARRPSSERSRYTSTDRPNSTTSNDDENQADSVSSHIQSLDRAHSSRTHSSQRHCGELAQFVCIAVEDEASSIGIELCNENPSPENAREVKPLPSHSTSRPVSALSASSGMDWIRSWSRSSSEPPSKMHGLPKRAATVDEADMLGKNFGTSSDPAEGDDRPILQFCQQRGITILSVEDGEEPPTNHLKLISHVDVTGQHSMLQSKTLLKPGAQHSGQLYGHAYDQRNVDDASESSGTKSRLDSLKMMLSGRWSNSNSAMSNDLPVLNERAVVADGVDVLKDLSVTSSDPAEEDGEEPPENHLKLISHVDATGQQHSISRSKIILKPGAQHCGQLYGHAYDQRNVDDSSESSGTKSRPDSLEMMLGGDDNRSLDLRNSGSVMSNDLSVLNDCGNREWNGSISGDSQSSLGDSLTSDCLPLTLDGLEVASNSFSLIKPLAQRG
uniref:PAS domain-containing protein n=1 Tax=Octactis speculum TaxID=3111310 RepID=A0A7S2C186_9STRA